MPGKIAQFFVNHKDAIKTSARENATAWVKDIVEGVCSTIALFLLGLFLVQLGITPEGQEVAWQEMLSPLEFWESFKGLVLELSQWNERVLLGLGLSTLALILLVQWRALRSRHGSEEGTSRLLMDRVNTLLNRTQLVGALTMVTAIFLSAYGYQQILWNVELKIPEEKIGIAFTRQIGASIAEDQLADFLRQMGHEAQIETRQLPVTFDARDTDQARVLARRIGADAVVIYRQEGAVEGDGVAATWKGRAAPLRQGEVPRYVAYLVFADPLRGVEIPVPQRHENGQLVGVALRSKDGVESPRLEATDVGRLMEATAGVLMYDQNRLLPGIAHLRNALRVGGNTPTDGLLHFFLANGYYLLDQEAEAAAAFDRAIAILEEQPMLALQDRLVLAKALTDRALLFFYDGRFEEAEALLRRAIALREPLDKDQSALADPVTFREVYDTFGTVYVTLMEVAERRGEEDAAALWRGRAADAAAALLSRTEDPFAQDRGIWLSYRTGECEEAYQLAYERLEKDPDNVISHRLLWKIAAMRDGVFASSLEKEWHLRAALALDPQSLPELQALMQEYALRQGLQDPAFGSEVRALAEKVLALDPSNVDALDYSARSVDSYATLPYLYGGSSSTLVPVGHERTYERLVAYRQQDPTQLDLFLKELESVSTILGIWAEEVQPGDLTPLLYRASLSAKAEFVLYNYAIVVPLHGERLLPLDETLASRYEAVWQEAVRQATRALESEGDGTTAERIMVHQLLTDLWAHRFFAAYPTKPEAAREAVRQARAYGQAAVALVEEEEEPSPQMVWDAYYAQANGILAARTDAAQRGDTEEDERYQALLEETVAQLEAAGEGVVAETTEAEAYFNRFTCPAAEWPQDALEASQAGETGRAVKLQERYQAAFPHDPSAALNLGWFRYLDGDLEGALEATDAFIASMPGHPAGHGNRAVILLARGNTGEALESGRRLVSALQAVEQPGLQGQYLISIGQDLGRLAQEDAEARAGVREVMSFLAGYSDTVPVAATERYGSTYIAAFNDLGAASFWAGDYDMAQRFYQSALAINPEYALARANLALVSFARGDEVAAGSELEKAAEAALRHGLDFYGTPLEAEARVASLKAARLELEQAITAWERFLDQNSALRSQGDPLLARLQAIAAGL